jgi:hypothetical protein
LGGGFIVPVGLRELQTRGEDGSTIRSQVPATDLIVRGSYPTIGNSWVAEVESVGPPPSTDVAISAFAYCLNDNSIKTTVTTQIASEFVTVGGGALGATKLISALCPPGSVLTGGGYRIDGPLADGDLTYNAGVQASFPAATAWQLYIDGRLIGGPPRTYQAYALCASAPFINGHTVETVAASTLGGFPVQAAQCDPETFTTAGGFGQAPTPEGFAPPLRVLQSSSIGDFDKWQIHVFSPANTFADVTATALCLPVPPTP